MTTRRPCPPAPGPLEDYAQHFDPLLSSLAQRRGLRDYLQGLLLPRDRNKTLTALADAEPIVGAQHRQVQRLQWFLSESTWDHESVNQRRIGLLRADSATAPHAQGVLVIDDTGDRKDGSATAHVARQYLGSVGMNRPGFGAVFIRAAAPVGGQQWQCSGRPRARRVCACRGWCASVGGCTSRPRPWSRTPPPTGS